MERREHLLGIAEKAAEIGRVKAAEGRAGQAARQAARRPLSRSRAGPCASGT